LREGLFSRERPSKSPWNTNNQTWGKPQICFWTRHNEN